MACPICDIEYPHGLSLQHCGLLRENLARSDHRQHTASAKTSMKEEAYSLVRGKSAYYIDNMSNCQYDNKTLLSPSVKVSGLG